MDPDKNKDPQGGGEGTGGDQQPGQSDEAIAKLKEQIDNLTKGIATYRDAAKNAEESAKQAKEAYEAALKEREPKVELSEEDEKKFESWAKAKGVVTADDLAKERSKYAAEAAKSVANTAITEFLEKHPEYDDDEKWAKVQEEFNLYKTPSDLPGYRSLLDRVHKALSGGKDSKERARAEARAEINNRSRLTMGGGSQGTGNGSGEADASIDSLMKRYPNLSREQIESRLNDLKALHANKK